MRGSDYLCARFEPVIPLKTVISPIVCEIPAPRSGRGQASLGRQQCSVLLLTGATDNKIENALVMAKRMRYDIM